MEREERKERKKESRVRVHLIRAIGGIVGCEGKKRNCLIFHEGCSWSARESCNCPSNETCRSSSPADQSIARIVCLFAFWHDELNVLWKLMRCHNNCCSFSHEDTCSHCYECIMSLCMQRDDGDDVYLLEDDEDDLMMCERARDRHGTCLCAA